MSCIGPLAGLIFRSKRPPCPTNTAFKSTAHDNDYTYIDLQSVVTHRGQEFLEVASMGNESSMVYIQQQIDDILRKFRKSCRRRRRCRTVTFKWYDQRYDLPCPELLKVHAIIARIFHASGAAGQADKALHDLGEQCVLAKDDNTDISLTLAVITLGVPGSRAGNV